MAPIIIKPRKRWKFKVSEEEFNLTHLILDALIVDYDEDYEISFNLCPISYLGITLHYADSYQLLITIPNDYVIFRPLKNDKHANVVIDMFEQLETVDFDSVVILNDKRGYKGYFAKHGEPIPGSIVYNAPTTPYLKLFMVAKMLLNKNDYDRFVSNLKMCDYRYYKRNRGVNTNAGIEQRPVDSEESNIFLVHPSTE